MSKLELSNDVHRFLFSATTGFVGECRVEDATLQLAFPASKQRRSRRRGENGVRSIVFSVEIEAPEERPPPSIVLHNYEWIAQELSALLCLYYGKLVEYRGYVQHGRILMEAADSAVRYNPELRPFDACQRMPNGPPLNLGESGPLLRTFLLYLQDESSGFYKFVCAAECYRTALEHMDLRPELSLAMFCSAIESLASEVECTDEELYDDDLQAIFNCVQDSMSIREVKILKQRLFQIKKRVAKVVKEFLPADFCDRREADLEFGMLETVDEVVDGVRATYDLRSRFLHTGTRRGLWYISPDRIGSERGVGWPSVGDKDLEKVYRRSLNLVGLERVVGAVLRAMLIKQCDGGLGTKPKA